MITRNSVDVLAALDNQSSILVEHSLDVFLGFDFNTYDILNGRLTGGHVMTYLAREADRMADRLLEAAGHPVPAPDRGRRWELSEDGNLRPGAVLVDDIVESSERFKAALATIHDWSAVEGDAQAIPAHRLVQVVVHLVDLGRPWNGLSTEDAAVAAAVLPDVLSDELSAYRVTVADTLQPLRWQTASGTTDVAGPARSLLAWATGRADSVDIPPDLPRPALRTWI